MRDETGLAKLSPSEEVRLELVARIAARLEQFRNELEGQPLVVTGSRKQPVVDGRVAAEAKLAAQLDRQLARLVVDVRNRAMLEQVRALTAG